VIKGDFRVPYTVDLAPEEIKPFIESLGTESAGESLSAGYATAYYDFVHLLVAAIAKAGTADDTAAIAEAMVGISYSGPFGETPIRDDHTPHGSTGMIVGNAEGLTLYSYPTADSTALSFELQEAGE